MSDLELPPANFSLLKLRTIRVEPAKLLRLAWSDPAKHLEFRTSAEYRFDSPDASFGVLYCAYTLETAFAESELRDNPRKKGYIDNVPMSGSRLKARRVIQLGKTPGVTTLKLIQLYGAGLAAARTDNRIAAVNDYTTTNLWAKAFESHPIKADGLIYMSKYTGTGKSIALFDRCAAKVTVSEVTPLLLHPEFAKLSDKFKLSIEKGMP
jgi:RES domain